MNTLKIRKKSAVSDPAEFWFNIFLGLSSELSYIMSIVDAIKIIVKQFSTTVKNDKLLTQLKNNSEYMRYVYEQIDITSSKTTDLLKAAFTTEENLKKIQQAQLLQAGILEDISQSLTDLNTNLRSSYKVISDGVNDLARQSFTIKQALSGIIVNMMIIQDQLKKTNSDAKLNTLSLHLSSPYQKIIYADARFNLISDGIFDGSDEINEIPLTLTEFAKKTTGYNKDSILYNIVFILNELQGNNFTGNKSSDVLIGSYVDKFNTNSPLSISPVSWIVSQYSVLINLLSRSLSLAGMCYTVLKKELPTSIMDNITHAIENEPKYLMSHLDKLIKSDIIENPGLVSSLYSEEWMKFTLDSGIDSKTGTFSLEADSGHAIVGFEFVREDKDRVIANIYQAKVLPYYCIDDAAEDSVMKKSVDLTGLIMGTNSFPHPSLCNNDTLNPTYGLNRHRRFNDNYAITQIKFTGVNGDGKQVLFNYQVYASPYDAETGVLTATKVLADDSNSVDVTEQVRKISDNFYTEIEKVKGLPISRLLDTQLSPLNGFYLFVQGSDLYTDPMVIMTDVTLYKQIPFFIDKAEFQ